MRSKISKKILSETSDKQKQKAINYGNSIVTRKQEYIGAFLDGYFSDKKLEYGMNYYSLLEIKTLEAEKKFNKYQKQFKIKDYGHNKM